MLRLRLETWDGGHYELPRLLEWQVDHTGSVPCDSLTAVCPYDREMGEVLPKAVRFTAWDGGEIVLRGVVDAYEISLSGDGMLVSVEGRGLAALLLDNESEAVTYGRATLAEVLRDHVEPYGLAVDVRQSPVGDGYTVPSGASQWKALQGFTRRFGGFDPCFSRDGTLIVGPLWGSGKRLRVDDGTPVLSLTKREERYGVISEVLIWDKVQGIRHRVMNPDFAAAGGRRRHVLYMPRSTAAQRRYTGEYQIAESALDQIQIELSLPWAFAAAPGDRVELCSARLGPSGVYDVVEARSRLDGGGERTTLVLSVR